MIKFQIFIYGVKDTYSHFIKIYENNDNFALKNVNHFGKVVNHQNLKKDRRNKIEFSSNCEK